MSFTAPKGTYYPGQVVPVTVTFSEPVNAATAKAYFGETDNIEVSAAEGTGYSNVLTFPYPVQEVDSQSLWLDSVVSTDLNGHNSDQSTEKLVENVTMQTPVLAHTFTELTASIDEESLMTVEVQVSENEKMTN